MSVFAMTNVLASTAMFQALGSVHVKQVLPPDFYEA